MSTDLRFELAPAADTIRTSPPGPTTVGIVVVGGFLIGGPFGAGIALLALIVWLRHPAWLGGMTAGLLALAAAASVIGAWPGPESLRQSFADDRPWAAAAGLAAGVSLLVVVARAAREDRDPRPAARADARSRSIGDAAAGVGPWLPYAAVALLAMVVSVTISRDALTSNQQAVVQALRAGQGFIRVTESGAAALATNAPAPLVLASLFPTAVAPLLALVTVLTAIAVMIVAHRLAGARVALVAGLITAVVPSIVGQRLPGALAALAVATAVLLAWPDRVTVARAVVCGAALTIACLSRPEALVLIPLLAGWEVLRPADGTARRAAVTTAAIIVAVTVIGLAPWALHVHRSFGAVWPAT